MTTYSQISFIYFKSIGGEPKQLPKERKIILLRKNIVENVNKSLSKIYIILTYWYIIWYMILYDDWYIIW